MVNNLIGKHIDVLDKGFVELIDLMPHPATNVSGDLAIVNAARVSFMGESKGDGADERLLRYLLRNQHTSPFEQVQFKFRVKAPLVTWWQWVRHRTFQYQSVNSQSGRYTPFDENEFYLPRTWRKQSASNKQGSDGVFSVAEQVEIFNRLAGKHSDGHIFNTEFEDYGAFDSPIGPELSNVLKWYFDVGFSIYDHLLRSGVAKEQARLFLPGFGVYYTWVISVNALNLMNFLRLRMAPDAQYEIRVYADAIYTEFFKPMLPWTAEAFEDYVMESNDG